MKTVDIFVYIIICIRQRTVSLQHWIIPSLLNKCFECHEDLSLKTLWWSTLIGNLGPISRMVFHHRSNSMEISISSHGNSNEVISAKFSTWHEGCAVLASVNICCDPMIRTLIVAKWIFHPIRTVSENRLRNWLHLDKPGLLGQQPNVVEHGSWSGGNYIIGNPFKIFHKTRSAARFRDVPSATLNAHITPSDKVLHNHWKLEEFWRK